VQTKIAQYPQKENALNMKKKNWFSVNFVRLTPKILKHRQLIDYFCGMISTKFPIRNILRLNWGLASVSFSVVFTFLFLFKETNDAKKVILYSVVVFISLTIKGFINLAVLLLLERRMDVHGKNFRKHRYLYSYMFNAIFDMAIFISLASVINKELLNVFFLLNLVFLIFIVSTISIILQDYLVVIHFKTESDLENSRLKTSHAEALNQLLRQQIHPHFLFNSLNTLKSLYKIDPGAAEEYLIRLSDFLRASVSNYDSKTTLLKDEIKLCIDYLEMQKIRFSESLMYTLSIPQERLENGYVPSFAIQTLIENAIKHNELTQSSPLMIRIQTVADRLVVSNNRRHRTNSEFSAGSGLANLAERYRIISEDELVIDNNDSVFSVSIKILDNEDRHY
jgi:sensor histidine kinase YesM